MADIRLGSVYAEVIRTGANTAVRAAHISIEVIRSQTGTTPSLSPDAVRDAHRVPYRDAARPP